jgi:hypothetical protein
LRYLVPLQAARPFIGHHALSFLLSQQAKISIFLLDLRYSSTVYML